MKHVPYKHDAMQLNLTVDRTPFEMQLTLTVEMN